jgi:hypothetical protein
LWQVSFIEMQVFPQGLPLWQTFVLLVVVMEDIAPLGCCTVVVIEFVTVAGPHFMK